MLPSASAPPPPPFSPATPATETSGGQVGAAIAVPHADHAHPRLTATASGVLDANGEAVITFTRTFSQKPAVSIVLVEDGAAQPVIFRVEAWTIVGGVYTGCTIKGQRTRTLPAVILLLTALVGYDIAAGASAGAEYSFIALQSS